MAESPETLLERFHNGVITSMRRPFLEPGQSTRDFPSRVVAGDLASLNLVVNHVMTGVGNVLTTSFRAQDAVASPHYNRLADAIQTAEANQRFEP